MLLDSPIVMHYSCNKQIKHRVKQEIYRPKWLILHTSCDNITPSTRVTVQFKFKFKTLVLFVQYNANGNSLYLPIEIAQPVTQIIIKIIESENQGNTTKTWSHTCFTSSNSFSRALIFDPASALNLLNLVSPASASFFSCSMRLFCSAN